MRNCASEVLAIPGLVRNDSGEKSPVAVIAAVPVIAVAAVAAMGHAEHALNGPHGAANTGANHAADGARDPVALMGSLLRAPHDTLGMARTGDCEQHEQCCEQDEQLFGSDR